MDISKHKEELHYLLYHLDSFIEDEVYQVLDDSKEDPHHSAVTLFNLIKCFLVVEQDLGVQMEYHNAEEYLHFKCFTEDEIQTLENKRLHESKYYIGKQY